jgi:hypothetical protein
MLTQLVRDLMGLGVGMEVRQDAASFVLPADEPARSRAEKAVKGALPLIRDHRADFLRVWGEVAIVEGGEPRRCGACRGWVFTVPKEVTWAFCESLYCPFRTDARAREFQRVERWRLRNKPPQPDASPIPD